MFCCWALLCWVMWMSGLLEQTHIWRYCSGSTETDRISKPTCVCPKSHQDLWANYGNLCRELANLCLDYLSACIPVYDKPFRFFSNPQEDTNKTPASARHKRGCNCKKSRCLKKYCECYQVFFPPPLASFECIPLNAILVRDAGSAFEGRCWMLTKLQMWRVHEHIWQKRW